MPNTPPHGGSEKVSDHLKPYFKRVDGVYIKSILLRFANKKRIDF